MNAWYVDRAKRCHGFLIEDKSTIRIHRFSFERILEKVKVESVADVVVENVSESSRKPETINVVQSLVYLEMTSTIIFIDDISQNHVLWNSSRHHFDSKRSTFDSSQTRYPLYRALHFSVLRFFSARPIRKTETISFLLIFFVRLRSFIRCRYLRPIFLRICIVNGIVYSCTHSSKT